MLIVLAGLPGAGKTTIARVLACKLKAVHLRIDTIEDALRSSLRSEVGPAGYLVAYRLAEDNLRLGAIVVADAVNPLQATRDAWRATARSASSKIIEVEVVCSATEEHRRRIEARVTGHPKLNAPTWQDVVNRRYDVWDRTPIVIDTAARTVDESVADLLARIEALQDASV